MALVVYGAIKTITQNRELFYAARCDGGRYDGCAGSPLFYAVDANSVRLMHPLREEMLRFDVVCARITEVCRMSFLPMINTAIWLRLFR